MAILIIPETLYILDIDMECQIEEDNEEVYKAYVRLMNSRFLIFISKLIAIIDYTL